jgi:hydrogenase maturation protease
MNDLVCIGVGAELRSDDSLGLLVARELRRRFAEKLTIVEATGDGSSLFHAWEGAGGALLIDAMLAPDPPGSVLRFDLSLEGLPPSHSCHSSHSFGVSDAVELARTLHILPRVTILYGIVGKCYELGNGLSDCVLKAIPELMQLIEEDLRTLRTV